LLSPLLDPTGRARPQHYRVIGKDGADVLLVDKVAEHVKSCRTQGLSIEGPVDTFTQVIRRRRSRASSAAPSLQ
jgi:hypothetical protein